MIGLKQGATMLALIGASTMAVAQSLEEERVALETARAQARAAASRAAQFEQRASAETDRRQQALAQSAAIASRIQSAEADIGAAEARVRLIEQLRARQRMRLAEKQAPAVRLLAGLQIMARRPPALALAQPGSLDDIVHTRALFGALLPVIRSRTAALRADLESSRRLQAQAGRALADLKSGRQRLANERAALIRLAALHRANARLYSGGVMAEQDRAIALGERARDIGDLVGQLQNDAARGERLASLPGPVLRPAMPQANTALPAPPAAEVKDRLPYRLPVAGRIVSGMGEVSRQGVRARGLTVATRPGAQAVAPAGGRIAFAGPYRKFGNIVIVDHGSGWTTLITGLAALDARAGDTVVQGSPLGRAPAHDPLIGIELRRGERPVDITRLVG